MGACVQSLAVGLSGRSEQVFASRGARPIACLPRAFAAPACHRGFWAWVRKCICKAIWKAEAEVRWCEVEGPLDGFACETPASGAKRSGPEPPLCCRQGSHWLLVYIKVDGRLLKQDEEAPVLGLREQAC